MKNTIITIYLLFLTFLISSAVFASKTFDGDIRNSYEKGMAYPVEKEKIKKHGWSFSIQQHTFPINKQSTLELLITDKDGLPVRGADVTMQISRPNQPFALPSLQAREQNEGYYGATMTLPFEGHWQVNADIRINEEQVHQLFKFYAEEKKEK